MTNDLQSGTKSSGAFKTFPEFSKLTLADRTKYEKFAKRYPPYSDLGFPTLMFWWNTLDSCAVSELNGNLIISYWLPGMEEFSGLALIGDQNVERSICEIFDWQRSRGEEPKLVHVPEFVMSHIEHPDMFICRPERDFDEYIFDVKDFYPLERLEAFRRKRVESFVKRVGEESIDVRQLNLSESGTLALVLDRIQEWRKTGYLNDSVAIEVDAINVALRYHDRLGTNCLALFVDGELHGFLIYYLTHDSQYAIVTNIRMNVELPWTLDYALFAFAREMARIGVEHINTESDMGSKFMRTFKLALGPARFFRKYTIEPAT